MTKKTSNQNAVTHKAISNKMAKQAVKNDLKKTIDQNIHAVKQLVLHTLEPDGGGPTMCVPSLFPSKSAPIKKSVAVTRNPDKQQYGAYMTTTDPDMCYWDFVYHEVVSGYVPILDPSKKYYTWPNSQANASLGCWFGLESGNWWKPSVAAQAGFEACHGSTTDSSPHSTPSSVFYYPGSINFGIGNIGISLTSQDTQVAGDFIIGTYNGVGVTPVMTGTFDLTNGSSTVSIFNASIVTVNNPVFYLRQNSGSSVEFVELTADYTFPGGTEMTNGWQVKPYSLFDLMGADAAILELQYKSAAQWKPVSCSVRFMQPASILRKGGSVSAAQMPGNSIHSLPGTPEEIYDYLGARQDLAYKGQPFKNGIHGSIIPEKLSDFEFRDRRRMNVAEKMNAFDYPFSVVAYQKEANDVGSFDSFKLVGQLNIAYELKSADLSLTLCTPIGIPFDVYQSIVKRMHSHQIYSENPEHWKKLKKIVTDIAKDERVQSAAKKAAKTGIKWLADAAMALPLLI